MGLPARAIWRQQPRAEFPIDSRPPDNQARAEHPCQDGLHSSGEAPAIFCTVVMTFKILKLISKGFVMTATSASPAGRGGRLPARFTAVATAALAAAAAAATIGAAPASASVRNWVMTGWGIHHTNQMDPATTSHFFNTNTSYGTGPNSTGNPISDGYSTNAVLTYTSYAQFASDLQNKAISPNYKWVLYDPEMWSQTPVNEQQNPALYLKLFGQLAHANGYKVAEVPARDLAPGPGPGRQPAGPGGCRGLHQLRHAGPDGHRRPVRRRGRLLHQRDHAHNRPGRPVPPGNAGRGLLDRAKPQGW